MRTVFYIFHTFWATRSALLFFVIISISFYSVIADKGVSILPDSIHAYALTATYTPRSATTGNTILSGLSVFQSWWVFDNQPLSKPIKDIVDQPWAIVPRSTWLSQSTKQWAHNAIRLSLIMQILDDKLVSFVDRPYAAWHSNFAITVRSGSIIATDKDVYDDLDLIIDNALIKIWSWTEPLMFTKRDFLSLWPIYLWKSTEDIKALGYQVVSSRYRTNKDPSYRRHNIVTAFNTLGNIRVLNPGGHINFLESIHYDEKEKRNYKEWLAIVQDEEIPVYGWGICGWSTAAYQWLITNTALTLKARNHSKRFTNLYTATINGVKITTPGIDATVFAWSTDLIITNTSDHPLIIVLNYNGNYGGVEEVMSLWFPQDQWSLQYRGSKNTYQTVVKRDPKTKKKYTEKVKTGCYTRTINGVNKTSCYKEIH